VAGHDRAKCRAGRRRFPHRVQSRHGGAVLAPPATLRPAADAAAASARRARRPAKPVYLDPAAHETPAIALAGAAREALRMADTLEAMLRGALDALAHGDRKRVGATKGLDDVLDHLNRAIKAYLTELDPDSLDDDDNRRWRKY
jgi:Na+/phosphate symporter